MKNDVKKVTNDAGMARDTDMVSYAPKPVCGNCGAKSIDFYRDGSAFCRRCGKRTIPIQPVQ